MSENNYKSIDFLIKPTNRELYDYCENSCLLAKNLYNTGNYYIRQLMSGLKKDTDKRFKNEQEVIDTVENNIDTINQLRKDYLKKRLENETDIKKIRDLDYKLKHFENWTAPTADKWYINYNLLEAVFKVTENEDYNALPGQVNQQILRELNKTWKGFFKALERFKKHPAEFTGMPKPPKYIEIDKHTCTFTNVICKLKEINGLTYLTFPKTDIKLSLGKYLSEDTKLQQVKIVPYYNNYKIILLIKDKKFSPVEKDSKRILGIDPGLNNFATISNNIGIAPIIIKGGVIKSQNQYYNKRKAQLQSCLPEGQYTSKQINSLGMYRDLFFNDYFYKIAHSIIRYAQSNNIDTIVIGHNKEQKQNINTGKTNNQNFVSVPFARFRDILSYLCLKNDIKYILQEESYSSKASFLDNDTIPIYSKNDSKSYHFSGTRCKRGLYKSSSGILLNADVNGASNIIRKAFPSSFADITDLSYLYKTVLELNKN